MNKAELIIVGNTNNGEPIYEARINNLAQFYPTSDKELADDQLRQCKEHCKANDLIGRKLNR